jgi:isoleucyl-tRNA synthetase
MSADDRPPHAPLYPALARKFHDAHSEELISAFWRRHDTFRRSIAGREGCPDWVFYEGPPTANGLPGVHHVMARLCKDIMCRYKTMSGHRVVRKAGWDTHGLPVERSVEKQLGIQGAQAILDYGLEPFNDKCRQSVWSCKEVWDEFTERVGYWVDLEHPYITYDNNYIESVWWILGQFHAKGMLYQGHKVVPYCPVCATPLSSHEMANSYRTVNDPSVYVKLKAKDTDEYFVTWTTTPWTLPSNVALAVGREFTYARVRFGGQTLILAEARLAVLEALGDVEVLGTCRGADLVGRTYEQLLPFVTPDQGRAFVVVAADFVTLDSGTGIVHLAPAFGEDDYQAGVREGLAFLRPVDANGQFTSEVTPWAGLNVKAADKKIIRHLAAQGSLLSEEAYAHEYPYHDRCDNPLIYLAMPSWFIRTSAMRDQLVEANQAITWAPPEVGAGRFGNWLSGAIDWSLSRNRFWGTPLNVWLCDVCGHQHLPCSRAELGELTGRDQSGLDLHRPHVDKLEFPCRQAGCAGTMRRTPEVIDCWFDSGAMPFAQYHYPFENRELFESQYPADFISEGIDQTRGWFYTMLVISTFLTGRSSYRSCLVNELILDKKGKKMSKSVGNTVDPMAIMREEGADPLRWYMVSCSPVWMPTRFDREGVKEAQRKLLATLENTYAFFSLYANLDGFVPAAADAADPVVTTDLLDRWILARLQGVTASVREDLDALHLSRAAKTLGAFVLDDVSNWYVRLSRRRFWKGDGTGAADAADKRAAFATLYTVLESTLRLLAPFVPFTAEEIHRCLTAHRDPEASVHLCDFPTVDPALVDRALEEAMAAAQTVVGLGRSVRQDAALKTRQPLGRLLLHSDDGRAAALLADPLLCGYVAGELNVKEVGLVADPRDVVLLSAKANFRALGPRFGKQAPAAAAAITAMTPGDIMRLRAEGRITLTIDGAEAELGFDEIQVVEEGVAPFVATAAAGLTVALDTTLTDELRAEGLCREIINKVQNLRKTSGLEVSDRIELSITGPDPVLAAVARHAARIAAETLATTVASKRELFYKEVFQLDASEIGIALDRA